MKAKQLIIKHLKFYMNNKESLLFSIIKLESGKEQT